MKRNKILRIVGFILCLLAFSGLIVGILFGLGVIYYDNGFCFNLTLFNRFKNTPWIYVIFLITQIIFTTFLSFVPGTSMMFIIAGVSLFGGNIYTFLLTFSGVMISSAIMYVIGRFGGYKICCKLIGEKDMQKGLNLLETKGKIYYPIMMACAGFPDDALVMCAGIIKMKFWYFLISTIIGRGIGVAFIVFGVNLVPFETFNCFYDWFIFITICLVWIIIILKLARKLDIWLSKKINKK